MPKPGNSNITEYTMYTITIYKAISVHETCHKPIYLRVILISTPNYIVLGYLPADLLYLPIKILICFLPKSLLKRFEIVKPIFNVFLSNVKSLTAKITYGYILCVTVNTSDSCKRIITVVTLNISKKILSATSVSPAANLCDVK